MNYPQNVLLPTQKLHYGTIFQPAIPETWQDFLTPHCTILPLFLPVPLEFCMNTLYSQFDYRN